MNAEQLLGHYERVANSPDAISRLRRFILDLAVRGKLTPQMSHDGTAVALLDEIAIEKLKLIKGGEIGKEKNLPAVDEGAPFELPSPWIWTRLGNITSYIQRGKSPKYAAADGVPVVSQRCVQWAGLDLTACRRITIESLNDYEKRRFLRHGDLLWNSTGTGTIGRVVRVCSPPNKLVCDSHVTVVRCLKAVPEYVRVWLRTDEVYGTIEGRAAGSTNQVELTSQMATNQIVPLPPLAEQHRIVAKVDELMALCDRLGAARARRERTRDRLTATCHARLNTPERPALPNGKTSNESPFRSDARFAINVLPALTIRPDQIVQLRQTVLNLAVRGKLVPQNQADESASKLLKSIHTSRQVFRKLASIDLDDLDAPLPELPAQWAWATVDQVAGDIENAITDGPFGSQLKTEHYIDTSGYRVIRLQNIGSGSFRNEHRSYIDESRFLRLSKHHLRGSDLVVAGLVDPSVRCCEVPADIGPCIVKADCYKFSVHPRISSRFLLHFLNSPMAETFASVHHHGMTLTRIGLGNFRRIPVPVPPANEQHRIVAKVDALLALCDQFEASLTRGENTRSRLLNALLHEAVQPRHDNVIDLAEARQRLLEKREAVACRVVQRLAPTRGFGRLRAVKPLYWAEAHCGIALGGQWGRAELGPFDQWIYSFEARAARAGWFSVLEHGNGDKVTRAEYRPSAGLAVKAQAAAEVLGNRAPEFERVLSLMADLNTDDSEIVTTLYAAWNDLLLEGKAVTDALVIVEVREHWHPSKARFTPARLQTWLNWLRTNRLVPHGQGPNTRHQAELI